MERLTESNPSWIDDEMWERACEPDCEEIDAVYRKLKEYEDLEEQGRLIKLPCKVGDTVYNTTWWDDIQEKVKVAGKTYYRTVRKYKVSKSTFGYSDIEEFGKTVFLTKSEAEAKLQEIREVSQIPLSTDTGLFLLSGCHEKVKSMLGKCQNQQFYGRVSCR